MEVNEYLDNAKDSMELAVEYLDDTLSHIRAGKASARLLDGIRVDYYGSQSSNLKCRQYFGARRKNHCHHSMGKEHVQGD